MRLSRRPLLAVLALTLAAAPVRAQGKFPPDSLVNLKFFPATTPVRDLINQMRFFTSPSVWNIMTCGTRHAVLSACPTQPDSQ